MRTNAINILLADDDVKNSLLLKKFLEAENYVVSYAPDGLTAWEMYHRQHPDLILLDVNMPAMNGFELAQRSESVKQIIRYSSFFLRTGPKKPIG